MENGVRTARVYHFGAFTVDARTGELSHDGRRTPLRDQSFQLLLALLEHPGELLTREELTGRLWGADTFVDFDRGLNKVVNHLRETLADSVEQPRFIETLPRKGYRFIAPVTTSAMMPKRSVARAATRARRGTLAVAVGDAGRWNRHRDRRRHRRGPEVDGQPVAPLHKFRRSPSSRSKTSREIPNNNTLPTG